MSNLRRRVRPEARQAPRPAPLGKVPRDDWDRDPRDHELADDARGRRPRAAPGDPAALRRARSWRYLGPLRPINPADIDRANC